MRVRGAIVALAVAMLAGSAAYAGQPVDWSGWYAGAFGGYISGELNSNDPGHEMSTGNYDDDGMTAGVCGGYRRQTEKNWVFGGEVAVPFYMEKGTAVDTFYFPGLVTYEADPKFAMFAGAQAGRAYGRALPYIFGLIGFVSADGRTYNVDAADNLSPGAVQSASATHFAWQLGAGVELQVSQKVFLGLRVATFIAERADYTMPWNEPGPNDFGFDATLSQVSVGYRF